MVAHGLRDRRQRAVRSQTERSEITDLVWNDWLIDQAVELVIALLKEDWLVRYGADAFKALIGDGTANPDRFVTKLAERLKEDASWPTRAKGDKHFAKAGDIVLPTDETYSGFLSEECYLDPLLATDEALCDLIADRGAKWFTLASLVRLRCAPKDGGKLETKVTDAANFHFPSYQRSLGGLDLQKRLAAALSLHPRRLSRQNRADLGKTASTLSATGELKPAV